MGLTKGPSRLELNATRNVTQLIVARLFEYLAATKAMGLTRVPGRDSFTSALIFALESLVTKQPEGRFTTIDLVNEIKEHAPYFPNDQEPVLSDRQDYSCAGRIMLQPLQKDGSKPESPRTKEGPDPANRHTVTLHLDFSEKPSNFNVERLGTELNDVFERNKFLGVSRVRWGGMRSVQAMVTRAARTFMLNVERNRSKRQLTPLNLSSANNGWLSPNPTSPIPMSPDIRQLSSSPTNMHSPQPQMQSFAVTGSLLINTPDYNSESNLKLTRFNGSSEGHHQDNRKRPRCSLEDE